MDRQNWIEWLWFSRNELVCLGRQLRLVVSWNKVENIFLGLIWFSSHSVGIFSKMLLLAIFLFTWCLCFVLLRKTFGMLSGVLRGWGRIVHLSFIGYLLPHFLIFQHEEVSNKIQSFYLVSVGFISFHMFLWATCWGVWYVLL